MSENRVLRKICGPKRDELIVGRRKLHNEELHNLYSSPRTYNRIFKLSRMIWAGNLARMREKRNSYRILVGKPESMRSLGRSRCRWEDNIKIELREIGWSNMDWIDVDKDINKCRAPVFTAMSIRVS
jgi:hypothetical protein